MALDSFEIIQHVNDPKEIYSTMDALLLMSRIEGLPNVVLEAQAFGLPVVACDVGGVKEAIYNDGPGAGLLLKEDTSPQAAAIAISKWLNDAVDTNHIERKKYVERYFSLDALSKQINEIYFSEVSNQWN